MYIVKTSLIDDKLCELIGYNNLTDFVEEHSKCEIFDLDFLNKLTSGKIVYVFFKNDTEFMYDESIETLELFVKYFNFQSDTTVKSNILEELGIIDKKIKINMENAKREIIWLTNLDRGFCKIYETIESFEIELGRNLSEIENCKILQHWNESQKVFVYFANSGMYVANDYQKLREISSNDIDVSSVNDDPMVKYQKEFSLERGSVVKQAFENSEISENCIYWYADLEKDFFKKIETFETFETFETWLGVKLDEIDSANIYTLLHTGRDVFATKLPHSNCANMIAFSDSLDNLKIKLGYKNVDVFNDKKPVIYWYSDLKNNVFKIFENVEKFETHIYRPLTDFEIFEIIKILKSDLNAFVYFKSDRLIVSSSYKILCSFVNNSKKNLTNTTTIKKPFIFFHSNLENDIRAKFENVEDFEHWLYRTLSKDEHINIENLLNSNEDVFVMTNPSGVYSDDLIFANSLESLKTKVIIKNAKIENNLPKVETAVENLASGVNTTIQKIRKFCKNTFLDKFKEYGATWLYYRTPSMLEQIESKLNRLKNKVLIVNESRLETWQSIYNYCLIVLMMNDNRIDYNELYKELSEKSENIRIEKNKDYSDSWQAFHEQTIIDIIFAKLKRITNFVNHDSDNVLNEKHISDIIDMANYAIYGAFKNS